MRASRPTPFELFSEGRSLSLGDLAKWGTAPNLPVVADGFAVAGSGDEPGEGLLRRLPRQANDFGVGEEVEEERANVSGFSGPPRLKSRTPRVISGFGLLSFFAAFLCVFASLREVYSRQPNRDTPRAKTQRTQRRRKEETPQNVPAITVAARST